MIKLRSSILILFLAIVIDAYVNQIYAVSFKSVVAIKAFFALSAYYLLAYRLMKKDKFKLVIFLGVIYELTKVDSYLIPLVLCLLLAFFVDSLIKRFGDSFFEKFLSILLCIIFYQIGVYGLSRFYKLTTISLSYFLQHELLINLVFGSFSALLCLWVEALIEEKRLQKDIQQQKEREHISLLDKGE